MAELLIVVLIIFLAAGAAYTMSSKVEKKAGEYEAEARTDKRGSVIGDNNIGIQLKESGKGANIFTGIIHRHGYLRLNISSK